jgi:hypothetical protein
VPIAFGVRAVWRSARWRGLAIVAPFAALLALAVGYAIDFPPGLVGRLQAGFPLMRFFRVGSRWGIFLPGIAAALLALLWPAIRERFNALRGEPRFRVACAVFLALSALELSWLATPIRAMPSLNAETRQLLEKVKGLSGTTVLDFPFCAAGGNGVCTAEFCNLYPASTTPLCFRAWHEKRVYGLYQARMTPSYCGEYRQEPYLSWHQAWYEQRCFSPTEWRELCDYLERHSELAAILVYPDIWKGASSAYCEAQFERYLGKPADQSVYGSMPDRNGTPQSTHRLRRYEPHCRADALLRER